METYESAMSQGRVAFANREIDRAIRRSDRALEIAAHSRDATLLKIEALIGESSTSLISTTPKNSIFIIY